MPVAVMRGVSIRYRSKLSKRKFSALVDFLTRAARPENIFELECSNEFHGSIDPFNLTSYHFVGRSSRFDYDTKNVP